jgi:hypothetical protein
MSDILSNMKLLAELSGIPVEQFRPARKVLVANNITTGSSNFAVSLPSNGSCFVITDIVFEATPVDDSVVPSRLIPSERQNNLFTEAITLSLADESQTFVGAVTYHALRRGVLFILRGASATLSLTFTEPAGFDTIDAATSLYTIITLCGYLAPESAAQALSRYQLVRL